MIKSRILVLLLILAGYLSCTAQTNVEILFRDAGSQTFTVDNTGKLYFDNGYLIVDEGHAVPVSFAIPDIQKILFSSPTDINDISAHGCRIYPNPASSFIKIENETGIESFYQLFALDGRLLMSGKCSNNESITISDLPQGLYLLRINSQTFKISKL